MGPGGFSVLRTGPRQPEPGHSVCSMGPEQHWSPVTGPGGSVSHGARFPVRTGSEGRIISAVFFFFLPADSASQFHDLITFLHVSETFRGQMFGVRVVAVC